jgi:hypothetical protein
MRGMHKPSADLRLISIKSSTNKIDYRKGTREGGDRA